VHSESLTSSSGYIRLALFSLSRAFAIYSIVITFEQCSIPIK